jgi:hypothetical protein
LVTLEFKDLLVFGTPLLTIVFAYLLLKRGEGNETRVVKRGNMLRYIHYSLLFTLVIVTVYSVYAGFRPFIYFLIVATLFIMSVLYGMNSNEKGCHRTLFLTAMILALSVPIAISAGNNFYPRSSGQLILETGSIEAYQRGALESGLYYYIPIETLISSAVTLVTGQTIIVPLIYKSFFLLAMVIGLFSLLRRLSHNSITGIVGVFFCLSIPSLSFIGRMWPLTYAIFYILLTLLLYKSPRASVTGLWIVSLPMIFAHPSGFVAVITVLLPLALLGIRNWPTKESSSHRMRLSVLTTIFVTFVYWTYTYLISVMVQQGAKFYSTIYSYLSGVTAEGVGQGYVPMYYYSGYEIFAYAWSVPAALSVAFLIPIIFQFIRKKKVDPSQSFTIVSAFVGLTIIFFAYLSYPSGEVGQYLIPVGYFLLLLSSSLVAAKLLTNKNKKYAIIAASLLACFILAGTYSPNWAPLEHPDFETSSTIHPYHVYLEAETVTFLSPTGATVYNDYDFPIEGGLYKPVRSVILQVCSGADPTQFARPPITLYGLKEERFSESIALDDLDTVYSSGYHRIIVIQLDQ